VAAGVIKDVVIKLNVQGGAAVGGAFRGMADAVKPAMNAFGQVASALTSMRALATTVVGGAVVGAVQKLARTGMEWVRSAEEQERLTRLLGFALERYGPVGEIFSRRLQSQASELQELAGIEEEATLATQKLLAQMGVAPYQLERVTKAAVLLSKAMGIDMHTAAMMLGRAALGSTEILSRYGIVLTDAEKKGDALSAVLQRIEGRMGGALAAEQESLTLGIKKMGLAMGENTELVGGWVASWRWLKDAINTVTDALNLNAKALAAMRQAEKERKEGKPAKSEALKALEAEGRAAMEAAVGRVPEWMDRMAKSGDIAMRGIGSLLSLTTMLGKGDFVASWVLVDEYMESITTEAKRQEALQRRIDEVLVQQNKEAAEREKRDKTIFELTKEQLDAEKEILDVRKAIMETRDKEAEALGKLTGEDFTKVQAVKNILEKGGQAAFERLPKELQPTYRQFFEEKYGFEAARGRERAEQLYPRGEVGLPSIPQMKVEEVIGPRGTFEGAARGGRGRLPEIGKTSEFRRKSPFLEWETEGGNNFLIQVAVDPTKLSADLVNKVVPAVMAEVGKLNADVENKSKRVAEQTRQNVAAAVGGG